MTGHASAPRARPDPRRLARPVSAHLEPTVVPILLGDPAEPVALPPAPETATLRRELAMERLRRHVYESVARQELLPHTLRSLVEMVEREAPRVSACLVLHAPADAPPATGPAAIA